MTGELRLPNITAGDTAGQVQQIKRYLYQLTNELNFALTETERLSRASSGREALSSGTGEDPVKAFSDIKALILKSSDIVNSYYDQLVQRFDGRYVSQSYVGTFIENTTHQLETNAQKMESLFTNLQEVSSGVEELLVAVDGNVKSGLLAYDDKGVPIYGIEVGQKTKADGVEVFSRFARFIPSRLSFYASDGTELAWFSDTALHVPGIAVTGDLRQGELVRTARADGSVLARRAGEPESIFSHEDPTAGSYGFGKEAEEADVFDIGEGKTLLVRGGLQLTGQARAYLLDLTHPVNSILETTASGDPGTVLGGSWTLFENTGTTYRWQRTE